MGKRELYFSNKYIKKFYLTDDGRFPNNDFPVLYYPNVLDLPPVFPALRVRKLFESNGWTNSWKSGIFTYHHYHSNTHEALGIVRGKTRLCLGGEGGMILDVQQGDVLVLPAGTAHKNLGAEHDVLCVGAYPDRMKYNIMLGLQSERPAADEMIKVVPTPARDPVLGRDMGLVLLWKKMNTRKKGEAGGPSPNQTYPKREDKRVKF